MRSHPSKLLMLLTVVLLLTLALAACGGEEPTPTPVPPTATVAPTNTPVPPTETPAPTNTPAPTATPEPVIELQSYFSEEAGLSLSYPADWQDGGFPGFAFFSPDEDSFMAEELGADGPVVLVVNGPASEMPSDQPTELIDELITDFDLGTNLEVVEGPTAVGQNAAYMIANAETDSGATIVIYVYVLVQGDYGAALIGAAPAAEADTYLPIFAAMAQTIELSEPTADLSGMDMGNLGSAGFLLYGDVVTGEIDDSGEESWSFIGLSGESVDIIVEPDGALDVVVDVLDSEGNSILDGPVDFSFGVEQIEGLVLEGDGSFYILISSYDGSPGTYTLSLFESGMASISGVPGGDVAYSEFYEGSVEGTEASLWTVGAVAGEFLDITVSPLTEGLDVVVDVLDENGRSLLEEPRDQSYDTEYIRLLPVPADGLYTIAITSYDGTAGTFELLVEESYLGQPASFIFVTSSIDDAEEVHDFPFSAVADDLVIIQVNPEYPFDVVIEVYNDDTEELIESVDTSTGFEELLFRVPEDGNYFFRILGFEGDTGGYEATLVGSDLVFFELAIGDLVIGRFGEASLIEYFIRVEAGDTLTIFAKTDDAVDLVLEIWDFDDNPIASIDDSLTGESEELTHTFSEGGLYVIRVSDFFTAGSGKFTMTIE
jgi:hypothetical protein